MQLQVLDRVTGQNKDRGIFDGGCPSNFYSAPISALGKKFEAHTHLNPKWSANANQRKNELGKLLTLKKALLRLMSGSFYVRPVDPEIEKEVNKYFGKTFEATKQIPFNHSNWNA